MINVGQESVKNIDVTIIYEDENNKEKQTKVEEFFPRDDPQMKRIHGLADVIEPNGFVYFRLPPIHSVPSEKVTIFASVTGTRSGKTLQVKKEVKLVKSSGIFIG